jgi:hypothetical protein
MVVEFVMRYALLSSMECKDIKNYWAAKCHDLDGQEALAALILRYKKLYRINVHSISEGGEMLLGLAWSRVQDLARKLNFGTLSRKT